MTAKTKLRLLDLTIAVAIAAIFLLWLWGPKVAAEPAVAVEGYCAYDCDGQFQGYVEKLDFEHLFCASDWCVDPSSICVDPAAFIPAAGCGAKPKQYVVDLMCTIRMSQGQWDAAWDNCEVLNVHPDAHESCDAIDCDCTACDWGGSSLLAPVGGTHVVLDLCDGKADSGFGATQESNLVLMPIDFLDWHCADTPYDRVCFDIGSGRQCGTRPYKAKRACVTLSDLFSVYLTPDEIDAADCDGSRVFIVPGTCGHSCVDGESAATDPVEVWKWIRRFWHYPAPTFDDPESGENQEKPAAPQGATAGGECIGEPTCGPYETGAAALEWVDLGDNLWQLWALGVEPGAYAHQSFWRMEDPTLISSVETGAFPVPLGQGVYLDPVTGENVLVIANGVPIVSPPAPESVGDFVVATVQFDHDPVALRAAKWSGVLCSSLATNLEPCLARRLDMRCGADEDCDGDVDVADITTVLAKWGQTRAGGGTYNTSALLHVLGEFGM